MRFFRVSLVVVGLLLVFVLPWPLTKLATGLPDSTSDPLSFVWILERMSQNLLGAKALYDGNILYPFRESLATSETLPACSLLYGFYKKLFGGSLLAFNLLQITFLIANFVCMYLFTRLFLRTSGALVAAAIFGFSLVRLAHLQHFHLMPQFIFPLFWGCAWKHERGGSGKWLLAMGGLAGLQLYFSLSLGIVLVLSALPYAGYLVWKNRRGPYGFIVGAVVTFALVSAAIGSSYYRISKDYGFRRPISDAYGSSANLGSWFLVTSDHLYDPLLGDLIIGGNGGRGREENVLFVGFAVLFLAYLGFKRLRACTDPNDRRVSNLFLYSLLFTVLLAFGTNLGLYNLLYYTLPGLKGFRTPARMGLSYLLFMAVLAGFGFEVVTQKLSKQKARVAYLAYGLLAFIFVLDTHRPLKYLEVGDELDGVSRWLRLQSEAGAVTHLPFDVTALETLRMYKSLEHGHPIANGYTGFKPPSYAKVRDATRSLAMNGNSESIAFLSSLGFRYVVVNRERVQKAERRYLDSQVTAFEDGAFTIYRLR
ncbi:MAG: hypothetical protein H6617_05360 [Bdellovibrionaceae bacterium]|nr:hypothetical protein [Bdellovibrionales bacterium]MCB9254093.1 hypothetical protein [Pseudobdellovibrionaceae bacterium]